jgi:hypothetical protein
MTLPPHWLGGTVGKDSMTRFLSSPAAPAAAVTAEARDLISRTSQVYVSLAHRNFRGQGNQTSDIRPDGTADLPLCSFGPGGGYTVDWQVRKPDLADPRRAHPPRTVGSILRRVTGWMLWDLKGWLIATHPSRTYRADSHPAALDPCGACGHSDSWPEWFVEGKNSPPAAAALVAADRLLAEQTSANEANSERAPGPQTAPQAPPVAAEGDKHEDEPANYPFPFNFEGSSELEPVQKFKESPAGRLIARLTADPRDPGTIRLFHDDDLVPSGEPLPQRGGASVAPASALNMESPHDPHSQTAQDPRLDSQLSRPQRLLANHAGAGRSTRRLKGNDLRTRRGPGKEKSHPPCPEQGSLFGGLADGEAA